MIVRADALSRRFLRFCATLGLVTLFSSSVWAQPALKPEEMAVQVLNAANKAFNEKQFGPAAERYREYLKTFGNQKDANLARYGLALTLLESPQKDYKGAVEQLNHVAGVQDFAERPFALYYLALAHRGLGHEALAMGVAKPQEAPQHRATAVTHFTPAIQRYATATLATSFTARSASAGLGVTNPPSQGAIWWSFAICIIWAGDCVPP